MKGTSLFRAILFENRLPWRYKELGLIRGFISSFHPKYLNSRSSWNKRFSKMGTNWRCHPYKQLLKYLSKTNFSLLDIGCALGDGCILIKKNFPKAKVSGSDFSNIAIKKAKKKNKKINFFVLDIFKQKIPKKYDYIIMVSILEHFKDPFPIIEKCLKKINKVLIIDCPYNEQKLGGEHLFSFNKKTLKEYDHNYYINKDRITYIIKK